MHEVLLERGAEKDLNRLAPEVFQRVVEAIRCLKDSPIRQDLKGLPAHPEAGAFVSAITELFKRSTIARSLCAFFVCVTDAKSIADIPRLPE